MEEVPSNKQKHKKIQKALLCALGITVVYGIIIYFIPKGGLDGLGYLLFTPVVFIGGFLFYYIFDYFRSIHKLAWLFSVSGILLLFTLYNSGLWNLDIWLRNLFHSDKLPPSYSAYQDINQPPLKFGSRTITLLYESEERIDHYLTSNNDLIIKREKKVRGILTVDLLCMNLQNWILQEISPVRTTTYNINIETRKCFLRAI